MFQIKKWTDNKGTTYDRVDGDCEGEALTQVSAIMLTHNCDDYLQYCIDALRKQVDRIYILDDGSIDKTKEIIQKNKEFVSPLFVEFVGMLDLSLNMNDNLKQVPKNQWLFYVNPDEILFDLPENFIRKYCAFLEKNKIYCSDVRFPDFIYNYRTLFAGFDWGEGPGLYWTGRRLFKWTGNEEFHNPTHFNVSNVKKGDFFQYNNEHTSEWQGTVVKTSQIILFHFGKLRGMEKQRGKKDRLVDGNMIALGLVPTVPYIGGYPSVLGL